GRSGPHRHLRQRHLTGPRPRGHPRPGLEPLGGLAEARGELIVVHHAFGNVGPDADHPGSPAPLGYPHDLNSHRTRTRATTTLLLGIGVQIAHRTAMSTVHP